MVFCRYHQKERCAIIPTGVILKNGVHLPIIQELSKETMSLAVEERLFDPILDEMTIKSGIVFNKSAGEM